jgi:predicted nucleic acid-binding protein
MKNSYFLDTSYSVALTVEHDQFHKKALDLSFELERTECRFVTTQAILLEIGNSLAKTPRRAKAVEILKGFASDDRIDVISLSPDLYDRAFILYAERTDKEWGLVDCL